MVVTQGEEHLSRSGHQLGISRPTVPSGWDGGYVTYRLGDTAAVGCTCGLFFEGPAPEAHAVFDEHYAAEFPTPGD